MTTEQEAYDRLSGVLLGHQATEIAAIGIRRQSGATWPRSEHGDEVLAALADSTTPDATMIVEHALPHLPDVRQRLAGGGSILDVGAGGAVHAIAFATTFPAATVHAVESDGRSLVLARRRLAGSDVADRIELREQDAADLDDVERHDLATLNLVLHETGGPARQAHVLRRVHRALRPGGGIVACELPYPDDVASYRTNPVHRRLAGIQLHEAVVGCGAITQRQLLDLVRDAGFAHVRAIDQPRPSRYVVVASKPAG